MRHILLTLAYDGTDFHGYQQQPGRNLRTVEGELKLALLASLHEEVRLRSAGRTDGGVHALGQRATILSATKIDLGNLPKVINRHLPRDLSVVRAEEVDGDFHPRYGAKMKHYRYTIYNERHRNALWDRHATHCPHPLDVEAMGEGLKKLVGTHDFSAFIGRYASPGNPIRSIESIEIRRKGSLIVTDFHAKSFLKNQIRIIMGGAMEIGRGLRDPEVLYQATLNGDRRTLGPTAAPQGLCLISIDYE
ncbi:MAG: tRNA pseudouridine(38-40) synthase TruA [Tissierellia bacterium]|nr:tRNA pseudouridine(38-40) synthase TruA [Tissierellia bacterium]